MKLLLSTPHGTLGTFEEFAQRLRSYTTFNSTRYIRNTYGTLRFSLRNALSTPHGTLGTQMQKHQKNPDKAKNLSTPHGTLGTALMLMTMRTVSILSAPHGTLGTMG